MILHLHACVDAETRSHVVSVRMRVYVFYSQLLELSVVWELGLGVRIRKGTRMHVHVHACVRIRKCKHAYARARTRTRTYVQKYINIYN